MDFNPRVNVRLDLKKHNPLLQFEESMMGLLKRKDRVPARKVAHTLMDRGLNVHVGGSVVMNALSGRPRVYNDIDLLVAGETNPIYNIIRSLQETIRHQTEGTLGSFFDYTGRTFHVQNEGEMAWYLHTQVVGRYRLLPSGNASPIDVNIVTLDKFLQYAIPRNV